jgi:GT2 family glycosyltransferase
MPNWNGRSLLEKNLPFVLKAMRNKKNQIGEIIIVDDFSSDDSVGFLKKEYKGKIKLVVHKTNRGFSSAVNTGVRTANGQLVCLLNTDVLVSENFLVSVIKDFSDEQVFAVSLHEKGFGYAKGKFHDGFIVHEPGGEPENTRNSFWASGGSAVFRRKIWMELKGLDEVLLSPFYWEDIDISYRAQKRGYKVLWEPEAHVVHAHEGSTSKLSRGYVNLIRERNQLLFIWKNLTSHNLFRKHIRGVVRRVVRHPGYIRVVFAALGKLGQARKLRDKEKHESRVSDEAIFGMFN